MNPFNRQYRMRCLFACLSVVLFISPSCQKGRCDRIPRSMAIELVDEHDSLLIGRKYALDSIRLMVENINMDISVQYGQVQVLYAGLDIYNNSDYFLYLSKSDTDTLRLTVSRHHDHCGDYFDFDELKYNLQKISPVYNTDMVFKVIKK